MKLTNELPPAISDGLRQAGSDTGDIALSIATDINLIGQYVRQWVVASSTTLWVFDEETPQKAALTLAFSETKEFRTMAVYGSGLLQAKVNGIWLDIVRYSNRTKYHFGRLAKQLENLREGKKLEFGPDDEVDPRRCAVSGVILEYPGQLSPFAVKHGAALSRVMQLMRPYWPAAFMMMVLLVVAVALDMIAPRLIQYLIDHVLDPKSSGKSQPFAFLAELKNPTYLLLLVVGAYAIAQVLRAAATVLNGRIASRVGTSISFD
ncbi:MAG: hypothetical protein H0W83_15620, partial [Planctomycetes bacterium]|nr:hypothetical protein [Planctomycetota bacterium]